MTAENTIQKKYLIQYNELNFHEQNKNICEKLNKLVYDTLTASGQCIFIHFSIIVIFS